MLGNNVSAESLSALGGQQGQDENDASESAEHARLLVEDCRRMLLGTSMLPIGAWGLIDADPSTGDINETEVDTILLLTSDEFIVADYDSHLDKIVRFENVPLRNLSLVELGLFQQQQMFKGPAPAHLCIRLNYMMDGVDGYFRMFRSPNIRFFNTTSVVIKKNEELVESMQAIVEFFRIALQSIGLSDVPFTCGGTLQRRKSRNLLQPPGIPRNLSESQLVQIGSKALSNVAGQFSKFGQSLNVSKTKNKQNANPPVVYNSTNESSKASTFYVGREAKEESDDDSDDNENSIYEPDLVDTVEQNPIYNENAFLPSVGIVMSNSAQDDDESSPEMMQNKNTMAKTSSDVGMVSITSITENIHVPSGMISPLASPMKSMPPPQIKVDSSSSVNPRPEMTLNLSGSQSDNTLKQLKTLTSPLNMLAKGVQSLGFTPKVSCGMKPISTSTILSIHSLQTFHRLTNLQPTKLKNSKTNGRKANASQS
jgi:phosphatidylinositol 4-phosphatase